MAIGGLGGIGPSGQGAGQGPGANAGGESAGKEFSLEKQATGSQQAAAAGTGLKRTPKKDKTASIVSGKKKKVKGAPRTIIVDGELYEVFLLAIA